MNEHLSLWLRTLVVMAVVSLFVSLCPTAGAADWVELFNGKDLSGWKVKGNPAKNHWTVGKAVLDPANPKNLKVTPGGNDMINAGAHGLDFYCEKKFGDATIELEVMVPKGSNSGIYVMGEYEIQILDSFGKEKLGGGDMGAIYGAAPPKINASKAPGEWQKYVIEYQAPKFDADGKKTANAKMVKVTLNDQVLHENVELKGPTGGALTGKEAPTSPLMFQGNHGQVAYRNIRIKPK